MSDSPRLSDNDDPLVVLGLSRQASEQDVRQRYLELVRAHPPERDPARFQQIHAAYKAAHDPLVLAQRLLAVDDDPPRPWSDILNEQKAKPPRLKADVLLSLGNRPPRTRPTSSGTADE